MQKLIGIDENDLRQLLNEREHLREQVTQLQRRATELLEYARRLEAELRRRS